MLTFKEILETTYAPVGGDERAFVAKHLIKKHKHPVATEAQFVANTKKKLRLADYDKGEDEDVYEGANLDETTSTKKSIDKIKKDAETFASKPRKESVNLDELAKDTLASYAIKARKQLNPLVRKTYAGEDLGTKDNALFNKRSMGARIASKKIAKIDKTSYRGIKEAEETIDEAAYSKYSSRAIREAKAAKVGNMSRADKTTWIDTWLEANVDSGDKAARSAVYSDVIKLSPSKLSEAAQMSIKAYNAKPKAALSAYDRTSERLEREEGRSRKAAITAAQKSVGVKEDLDESFKVGALRLKDGTSVTLSRTDVDSLTELMHELNTANRAKMHEKLHSNAKNFGEILAFANQV